MKQIRPLRGAITIKDMMCWSRFHSADLNGLRPMCEDAFEYEAAMICKIPEEHANLLSSGWFVANHACASIYVPVHICDNDIYEPYQTGEAAALSLDLLHHLIEGKTAGPVASCLPPYNANDMRVIDDNTLVFRQSANRVYVANMQGGCPNLGRGGYTMVTKQIGGKGLCRGDSAQVVDLGSGMTVASGVFNGFTPYAKP